MKIPLELKDFAVWLNPSNLKVFRKIDLVVLAGRILRTKADLIPSKVEEQLALGLSQSDEDRGVFVLRVYFYQLMVKRKALCLDLRPQNFFYQDGWHFIGKNLGHCFSTQMSVGLVSLYQAFYESKKPSLLDALEQIGLMNMSWSQAQRLGLEELFLKHFLQSEMKERKQNFKFRNMLDSFSQIFTYIRNEGGRVPSEFGLLGIYLTSLYINLDPLDHVFDVEACYLHAKSVAGKE